VGKQLDFYCHNACLFIQNYQRHLDHALNVNNGNAQGSKSPRNKANEKMKQEMAGKKEEEWRPNFSENIRSEIFVIQKYIEDPLLIQHRKFDIRLWVLVNMVDITDQKCYLFSEGYIRMSSHPFSLDSEDIDQPFVHLTNNAI
jgi:hypothetical protein